MYERAALVANTVSEDSGYLGVGGLGIVCGLLVAGRWSLGVLPGGVNGFDFSDGLRRQDTR